MRLAEPAKYFLGLVATVLFRVIPMPLPNLEPIMATALPFAKRMGPVAGAAFAFVALASWDLISGRLGLWTLYAGATYAVIGYGAGKFFASRKLNLKNRVGFAAGATVIFDAATALVFGWQFGQPLSVTVAGQVPFTAYHLLGNVLGAAILTPAIEAVLAGSQESDAWATGRPSASMHAGSLRRH
ncbi:MAG: hypothetical protein V1787_00885 [Candidatus Micrarchaeota archaeon]